MKQTYLIFLISFFLIQVSPKKCGEEEISNCLEWGTNENSNSCGKCEAGHFPLLENLLCLSCDDPIYNQAGCEGECDSKDYSKSSIAYCKNCKEGYFNEEGLCYKCEQESPGCLNCTSEKNSELGLTMFKCTKCLNEKEYRLDDDFRCVKCNDMLYKCKKCHYIGEEGFKAECDECESEYYVNGGKQCSSCYYENLPSDSGRCYYCSTKSLPDYCSCDWDYVLFNYSCYKCPENCFICEYDPQTKSTKCLRCSSGYILNSAKECINCGYGCQKCLLDRNSQPLCFGCYSGYTLEENLCLSCPDGCSNCKLNSDKTGTVCINCNDEFIFDPKTNKCIRCADIDEIGSGCSTCRYNILTEKYECITCKSDYYSSYSYRIYDYTFV